MVTSEQPNLLLRSATRTRPFSFNSCKIARLRSSMTTTTLTNSDNHMFTLFSMIVKHVGSPYDSQTSECVSAAGHISLAHPHPALSEPGCN